MAWGGVIGRSVSLTPMNNTKAEYTWESQFGCRTRGADVAGTWHEKVQPPTGEEDVSWEGHA